MAIIPEVMFDNPGARSMPVVGLGTSEYGTTHPAREKKTALLNALELGYRHFDTASFYQSEAPLGEAIAEALQLGLISSRSQLFVTSKLWCTDAHPHLVRPALEKSLRNLQLDYLDLYLIHLPISSKPGSCTFPINREDAFPLELKPVWAAMEECQKIGLTKLIGVSNFGPSILEKLLSTAKIPPAVNQVEMNPSWRQVELREYCKRKGIHVTCYSPLGGTNGPEEKNLLMKSQVLKDISRTTGKTVPQISLRWLLQHGVSLVVKSFNKERQKENLQIFDWDLTAEECQKIDQIPQQKRVVMKYILSKEGTLSDEVSGIEIY